MATKSKSQAKRKPIQSYAFIDTNIFLDFYRAKTEATLSMIEKLDSVKGRIICTYQVEMEFLKNRQGEITNILRDSVLNVNSNLPAVISDTQLSEALKIHQKDIKKKKHQLEKQVLNLVRNPGKNDRVFKVLDNIFNSKSNHVLTRDMPVRQQIKKRAWRRFILGYPPRKNRDTSIGDALNWEWIIQCAKELKGKFIIVSRDSDFGSEFSGNYFLNDQLKSEFRNRVGKKSIILTRKLSDALKLLEVHVTKEELKSEAEVLSITSQRPNTASILEALNKPLFSDESKEGFKRMSEKLERFKEQMQIISQALRGRNDDL